MRQAPGPQQEHESAPTQAPSKLQPSSGSSKPAQEVTALPAPSLPKGGGAIRSIGETFRVNPATGTGGLSIPLPLPSARNGAPQLALSYDSGQGQGPFGIGWSVSIPSISRGTEKFLPQYQDDDIFILAGAEELVPLLDSPAPDEGDYCVERFRPRVEAAFSRIERLRHRDNGDTYWRVTGRDNTTSIFGRSPEARLADPKEPSRVFRWLLELTYDDRGNAVWYEYKREDSKHVPADSPAEASRIADPKSFANLYLKRVHYGNRRMFGADPLEKLDWCFEVVLDYGDHDEALPAIDDTLAWPCRRDPFSSFKSGFDVRTYRLCRRVLVFHWFSDLGTGATLVRSIKLDYDEASILTYLTKVTETGWIRSQTDSSYRCLSTPPVEFDYTRPKLQSTVKLVDPDPFFPDAIDGKRHRALDLDGEGVSGVLSEHWGGLQYRRNEGGGNLAPPRLLRALPSALRLDQPGQQLASLDGDGQLDLLLLAPPVAGYFERIADIDGFAPFVPFRQVPRVDWSDPNVRMLDLDGDGLPDVLVTENDVLVWYRSLGREGFDRPRMAPLPVDDGGSKVLLADATQSIHLADITGDGLTDIVRIRNGEVCYWPNLGYGHFGAKIVMGNAPLFDRPEAFDPRRIRIADIDGSGTSDIVYLGVDAVRIYLNEAGNALSVPIVIDGLPIDSETHVDVTDFLGQGTACIVWSSTAPFAGVLRYVDLLGGVKPHLLCKTSNNLGLETHVDYAPSTQFYLKDRREGKPWATRLPFPVHVIARAEVYDAVRRTRFVSTYHYRHGYFDPVEREFRGFGRVDQTDAESFFSDPIAKHFPRGENERNKEHWLPPVRTCTWYDTGAFLEGPELYKVYQGEYYGQTSLLPEPCVPVDGTPAEAQEAVRARKGMLLRREVFAEDGTGKAEHPYLVEEHRYEVKRLQARGENRHAVYHAHERESLSCHYERNPDDPRRAHTFVLEVDEFGNVLRSAAIAYPRLKSGEAEQKAVLATYQTSTFINKSDGPGYFRFGLPKEAFSYELCGLDDPGEGLFTIEKIDREIEKASEIPFEAEPPAGAISLRPLSHQRWIYRKNDLPIPLPLGEMESLALLYQQHTLAIPAQLFQRLYQGRITPQALASTGGYTLLNQAHYVSSGIATYDPARFYLVTAVTDPFGNTAHVEYDEHALLAVEAHSSDDPTFDLVTKATNDYRVLAPKEMTDPNGNRSAVKFDELGRVVATIVMGKLGEGKGDTYEDPTTRIEYDPFAWKERRGPASVRVLAREEHGLANRRWQESWGYSDGAGHEVMRKVQAEPGDDGAPRWVGTGRTVLDNKGNPVKQYEPYFSATSAYEDEDAIVMTGVTPIFHYDPLGRNIRTDFPDGTFASVAFDPWEESHADANDNVEKSDWYKERQGLAGPEGRAAALAREHRDTPSVRQVDALGRTFLAIEDNGSAGKYPTRTQYDIQGNVLRVTDARGVCVLEQIFDAAKRVLWSKSCDAGEHTLLPDAAGKPLRAWDARNIESRPEYDRLRRPTHLYVRPEGEAERLVERTVYGEFMAEAEENNLRGRAVLHFDGAGMVKEDHCDFKGNLLQSHRRLLVDVRSPVDWRALAALVDGADVQAAAEALLEPETESYVASTEYDALNRPTCLTAPDGSETRPGYNEAGLLERMDVRLSGATAQTPYVLDIDYNAKGQRERIVYGNGVETRYEYDRNTFLLKRQWSLRASDGARLEDRLYTYDPVHNITELGDEADSSVFFRGQVVEGGGRYRYDAIYRLIEAEGREHPGQQQVGERELGESSVPHANDMQALRRYVEQYDYDRVGNILRVGHRAGGAGWTRRYAYGANSNRLLSTSLPGDLESGLGSARYEHDAAGNMVRMPHLARMDWDYANRLSRVDLGGGGTAYYAYDGAGQRVRKVVERRGGLIEERIYLGGYEVYRRRRGRAVEVERKTLHVMDDRRRIALVETKTVDEGEVVAGAAGRVRYQLANHLESACVEVDEAGRVISYEEFFPYGAAAFRSARGGGEVSAKRYRYNGKERDEETGLHYYGARYLAAWLGRWTSADPIGTRGGLNLFAYVRNNPIKSIDPTGTEDKPPPASKRPGVAAYAGAAGAALRFKFILATNQTPEQFGTGMMDKAKRVFVDPVMTIYGPDGMLDKAAQKAVDLAQGEPPKDYVTVEEHEKMLGAIVDVSLLLFPGAGEVKVGIPGPLLVTAETRAVVVSTETVAVDSAIVNGSSILMSAANDDATGSSKPVKETPPPEAPALAPRPAPAPTIHGSAGNATTPHYRGSRAAPKTWEPNAIWETEHPNGTRSVVYYNEHGVPFSHEDYGQVAKHYVTVRGERVNLRTTPHEHQTRMIDGPNGPYQKNQVRLLDKTGKPISEWVNEK